MSSDTTRVREIQNGLRMMRDKQDKVPTAGCPSCRAPLIGTMAFDKYEFLCLECGHQCGWMEPYTLDSDEVAEWMARLQAEWDEHASGKLLYGYRLGCEQCNSYAEKHREHATPEEIQADAEARAWIKERTGRAA